MSPLKYLAFGGWPLHPDRMRVLRDIKLQITLGKLERFLQSWRFNKVKPVRCLIDDGSSSMAVLSKESSNMLVMFLPIFGNFLSFEQPDRIKNLRVLKLISCGRFSRRLQSFRFNKISRLRPPTESCNACNPVQPWKINLSIFGNPLKLGVWHKFWESLRSMSFSLSKFWDKTISKYRKLSNQYIIIINNNDNNNSTKTT